jgi:hypothetical protein
MQICSCLYLAAAIMHACALLLPLLRRESDSWCIVSCVIMRVYFLISTQRVLYYILLCLVYSATTLRRHRWPLLLRSKKRRNLYSAASMIHSRGRSCLYYLTAVVKNSCTWLLLPLRHFALSPTTAQHTAVKPCSSQRCLAETLWRCNL